MTANGTDTATQSHRIVRFSRVGGGNVAEGRITPAAGRSNKRAMRVSGMSDSPEWIVGIPDKGQEPHR